MGKLRGKKPEAKQKRLKLFLFGPASIGKTTAAIQFPRNYIIDLEKGTDFYHDSINKQNSVVFQSNNPDEIREEVYTLLTTKHDFLTVTIDPVTQLYNAMQDKWTNRFVTYAKQQKESEMQDFGMRYWSKVKSEFKSIQRMLLSGDFNLIVTSHQKDIYGPGMSKLGVSFDSMKGDDYLFDYIFRLELINGKRMAFTVKERSEIGNQKFPEMFEWSYENFKKFYGQDILEKESTPIEMATPDDVLKLTKLLEIVNVDENIVQKWLAKAEANNFHEMTKDQIEKCVDYLDKKLKEIQ
jgi:GTPase SAR1 family protein